MSNLLSSPQTPGGTAVSCYATSLPLPLSPSSSRPFPVRAIVTSFKKKRDEKHSTYIYWDHLKQAKEALENEIITQEDYDDLKAHFLKKLKEM
jgi:hypothetical protein